MAQRRQFGKVRRLPSGRWQARYRGLDGIERSAPTTFATKGDASRYLARIQTELDRGEWRDPALARITFAAWTADYLANARHKRATTRARDEVVARKHLVPVLGQQPLAAITPLEIRQLVEGMASRLAPATVRTNYGVLKAIFNAAVEADIIVKTPCRSVRLRPEPRIERASLSADDLHRLARAMPAEYQAVIYVAGVLGLRWSEVAGLRISSLDFLRRTLTVSETVAEVNGQLLVAETKTSASRRMLAVPPFVMDALARHLAVRGRPGAGQLLFTSPSGGPLRATNFRQRVWRPAVAAAGLERLTFHGLRHAAASFMVDSGEHPRVIQHRLGHSTARLSMELYAHVSDAADREVAQRLDEMLSAGSGATDALGAARGPGRLAQ